MNFPIDCPVAVKGKMNERKSSIVCPPSPKCKRNGSARRRDPTSRACEFHLVHIWPSRSVAHFRCSTCVACPVRCAALLLIAAAWLILPVLALTDRIAFDGSFAATPGSNSIFLHLLFGYRKQLAIDDFETVETQAVRTLRRGGTRSLSLSHANHRQGKRVCHRFRRSLLPAVCARTFSADSRKQARQSQSRFARLSERSEFSEPQDPTIATRFIRHSRRYEIGFQTWRQI